MSREVEVAAAETGAFLALDPGEKHWEPELGVWDGELEEYVGLSDHLDHSVWEVCALDQLGRAP